MPYSASVYKKAKQILDERRQKALNEQEAKHAEVTAACPEIAELERKMAQQGANIVRAIGMGENAQAYILKLAQENLAVQEQKKLLMAQAGFAADYLEPKYTCPKCGDTGTCGAYYCDCYKKLVKEIAYAELSAKSPLKLCSFDNFDIMLYPDTPFDGSVTVREHMTQVLSFCKEYAADFDLSSQSLLMTGHTGLGKTHLSLAIAREAVKKGFTVVYDTTQNVMNKLQREHFGKGNGDEDTELLLEECDLLILDDLGAEFSTQFTVAALYNIINTRMLRNAPVIISTNLSIKEISDRYSGRIASRLIGDYIRLVFDGRDVRQLRE